MTRSKYNSRITYVDGIRFASQAEAHRYAELKLLLRAGEISDLKLQPKFEILPKHTDGAGKKHRAAYYIGDFEYIENGKRVVEDVKGKPTELFRLKAKMFVQLYPAIDFRIVK